MPRPKPLVALHGAVNFDRLVPFDSAPNAPPLAANDILVMRKAAGGDNKTLSIGDITATGAVNIAQLLGGVNNDMLFRRAGIWTGTGSFGLSYEGFNLRLDNNDISMEDGGSIGFEGGGGIGMEDDGEITIEGGGIFLEGDAEIAIEGGPGITLEDGAGLFIPDDGDIVMSEGVITSDLDGNNGRDLSLLAADSATAANANGGSVNIEGGDSDASGGTSKGGDVSIKGGDGIGAGSVAGGDILAEVGIPTSSPAGQSGNYFVNTLTGADAAAGLQVPGTAGLVSLYGIGRSGDGQAGNLELWGGYASGAGAGSDGGNLMLFGGGQGGGVGTGGDAMMIGGESDTIPGSAVVLGGEATVDGNGGGARVQSGDGFGPGNNSGGTASLLGGRGTGFGTGGGITIEAGLSGSGAVGNGGPVSIGAGNSNATNGPGGNVTIGSGNGAGTGDDGEIRFAIGVGVKFRMAADGLSFHAEVGSGPAMLNVGASGSVPVFIPNRADPGTGFTRSGLDQLSHVGNNVETLRVRASTAFVAAASNLLVWDYDNAGLTFLQFGADNSAGAGFKTVRVAN